MPKIVKSIALLTSAVLALGLTGCSATQYSLSERASDKCNETTP